LHEHRTDLWDDYAATVIATSEGQVLAGPDALGRVPWEGPVHVITAWNPNSRTRLQEENDEANRRLADHLDAHGIRREGVVGRSADGKWSEDSFLVHGLGRADATRLGEEFGQAAIFELTADEMLVARCSNGQVVSRTRRRR
jgi:hypothetical protein